MKYLLFILSFSTTYIFHPLLADIPTPPMASFLIRDPETTNKQITARKKPPNTPSNPSENSIKTKHFLGVSNTTLIPPVVVWMNINAWGGSLISSLKFAANLLCLNTGILMSKKYLLSNKVAKEYRFDLYPRPSWFLFHMDKTLIPFFEFTYQKITYKYPKNSSSIYSGKGFGISTFQGIPFFLTVGKEFNRFSSRSSFVEAQISVPFLILLPFFNIKLSCGIAF